jgi:hypothetical protein
MGYKSATAAAKSLSRRMRDLSRRQKGHWTMS